MEPKTKITEIEFRQLTNYVRRAHQSLRRSLEICPDLLELSVGLADGHQLVPAEMLHWLEYVRGQTWKYGPKKHQEWKIKRIVKGLPKG